MEERLELPRHKMLQRLPGLAVLRPNFTCFVPPECYIQGFTGCRQDAAELSPLGAFECPRSSCNRTSSYELPRKKA